MSLSTVDDIVPLEAGRVRFDWLMGEPDWEAARSRAVGPTWLVNMHLDAPMAPRAWFGSAGTHAARIARIRETLPEAWVPVEPLASRHYPPPAP